MRLFWRHSFIFRMALILVLSGISSAGLGTVVTPIMTGYFGLKKDMSTFLAAVAGVSAFTNMVVVLRPLMRRCGDVNALRMCLGASAVFPVLFAMCTEVWHLALLFFLLIGWLRRGVCSGRPLQEVDRGSRMACQSPQRGVVRNLGWKAAFPRRSGRARLHRLKTPQLGRQVSSRWKS